jgi:hypothetical protein
VGISVDEFSDYNNPNKFWECDLCHKPTPLPEYTKCNDSVDELKWGDYKGQQVIEIINQSYNTIVTWRRNLFMVPTGAAGQDFVEELTKCINHFNLSTPMEEVALKLLMIAFPLLLQKPSKKSKSRDHVKYLKERLVLWREGKIHDLLRQGKTIQDKLTSNPGKNPQNTDLVFSRLMLQGKVSAALRWVGESKSSVHQCTTQIIEKLKSLHPPSSISCNISKLYGPENKVENVIYEDIDGDLIQQCIKHISGAPGPSGGDADLWQRLLCTKQLKNKPKELCDAIAEMCKKLATTYVDPKALESFNACRLIPLVKDVDGVRPIGIGEILHRIVAKAIVKTVNSDVVEATTPIQLCSGIPSGVEAAVHSIRKIYEDPKTEAIMVVDASNAFNCLNRNAALNNIRHTCPQFAKFIINTYRTPAKLFIHGSEEVLKSEEGTTQGDAAAMSFYSCSTMPLIHDLKANMKVGSNIKQAWYADDSAAGGSLHAILSWWNNLKEVGPKYGYYPKAAKTWLIVKPDFEQEARTLFPDLVSPKDETLNITTTGKKYLGSFIGTEEGKADFISNQIDSWTVDIEDLSRIAEKEPQLAYAAFVFGTSRRWNYVCRTTPGIDNLLCPLDRIIETKFIPAIVGKSFIDDTFREMISLPARCGGMSIPKVSETANQEYENSIQATSQLTAAIVAQNNILEIDSTALKKTKEQIKENRQKFYDEKRQTIINKSSETVARIIELASEKGVSCWLTSLPLKDYGFSMNKQEFHDAIALRYDMKISNVSGICLCNQKNSINHALTCHKGGYTILRHNSLRDTVAELLTGICKDVVIEPPLLELNGEQLTRGTITSREARLDVSARSFWSPMDKVFTDVRVFHPHAPTNARMTPPRMYAHHEYLKKRDYLSRVIQVEKASFTPLVFSTTGGMGREAERFMKRLAEKMSFKDTGSEYSTNMSYLRRRLRFDLLKTTLISLRGFRGKKTEVQMKKICELDLHLEKKGSSNM